MDVVVVVVHRAIRVVPGLKDLREILGPVPASDIMAPLDGEIVEVNEALAENPGMVNDDPLGEAWFFKMKPADMSQMDEYMDEAAYKALID